MDAAFAARVRRGGPARVNLIGHSMVALVVRWYLLRGTADVPADGSPPPVTWAGTEQVRHVILVDTFPSAYVVLPRPGAPVHAEDGAPVTFTDVAVWERLGWGAFAIASDSAFPDGLSWLLLTQPD